MVAAFFLPEKFWNSPLMNKASAKNEMFVPFAGACSGFSRDLSLAFFSGKTKTRSPRAQP